MTRCSTPSSRKAFRISTKCGFIQVPSSEGPRLLGCLPAQCDPLRWREGGVIGLGLRVPDPTDPDGPRRPVESVSGCALPRRIVRLVPRRTRGFSHASSIHRQRAFAVAADACRRRREETRGTRSFRSTSKTGPRIAPFTGGRSHDVCTLKTCTHLRTTTPTSEKVAAGF